MRNRPEIEGELRSLLEEIAASSHSSARLVPRRPLRGWFDGGEAIRARDVDGTRAERHLIAAHREALAATLLEAAKIAYWKAPVLSLRPIGPNGETYDASVAEQSWRHLARKRAGLERDFESGVSLLRMCLSEIPAARGHDLALASLSLVPSDAARYYVTRTLPWGRPRTAISLLRRLADSAPAAWRVEALSSLGARLCAVEDLGEAREAYRAATQADERGSLDWAFVLNLGCCLGDQKGALTAAAELGRFLKPDHPHVSAAKVAFEEWWRSRTDDERAVARKVRALLSTRMSETAAVLCEAFGS